MPHATSTASQLHVYTLKETLKRCNWLQRKCWMMERLELLRMQSHWSKFDAPFFPFGYHDGILYKLIPDPFVIATDFYVNSEGPFPSGVGDDSMLFLKFELRDDYHQHIHGFSCAQLGRLYWKQEWDTIKRQEIEYGRWKSSSMIALVEILDNGCAGPIWILRLDKGEPTGRYVNASEAGTGPGDWILAKIANSIDDVGLNMWSVFQEISAVNIEFLPLYQTSRKGFLKVLLDRDEQMEAILDDDAPMPEIPPLKPRHWTDPVTFLRNHWAGIDGVFFSSFLPS